MSGVGVSSLGPQCLSCKRRRVKCDSTTPSCRRCLRDDIECPGFVRKLKWNHYRQPTTARNPPNSARPKQHSKGAADDSALAITSLTFPESADDKDDRLLFDSSQYFNTNILPHLVPAFLPFRRDDQQARQWHAVPSILRNLMRLLVLTDQANRSGRGPDSTAVLQSRAQSLSDLKTSLTEAALEPHGIVLSCIITFMGIELQNPTASWLHHFNAAQHIIQLRGGFAKCFFDLPYSQRLFVKYMMVDIFTAATCTTEQLHDSVRLQAKYIPILLLREQFVVEGGHLCPQPLLQAVIKTNILRLVTQKHENSNKSEPSEAVSFETILDDITAFDPPLWAEKVSRYGLLQPPRLEDTPTTTAINAWRNIAKCYRYAALLYLILSLRAPTTPEDHEYVVEIQKSLAGSLESLFSIARSDPDGPIETQLWKFVFWPATISVYVSICWCCSDAAEMERELERARKTAEALQSRPVSKILEGMREIARARAVNGSSQWKWNDGFPSRSTFAAC